MMRRCMGAMCAMLLACMAAVPAWGAVGGGYTACGLRGEYFANADLTSPSAFTRQDNRLDFDWANALPVGGSNTPAFRAFPHNGFSVRWTGQLVPRFTENYMFSADADDGVRVWVGGALVIDRWTNDGQPVLSGAVALTAGSAYDIVVEYRQDTGTARMVLKWTSPSTPMEVIDPLSVSGFNLTLCNSALFADDMKYSLGDEVNGTANFFYTYGDPRNATCISPYLLDADLWPRSDCLLRVNAYFANASYLLQFTGQADVTCTLRWFGGTGKLTVGGTDFTTLPAGVSYDPATNVTTAIMTPPRYNGGATTYAVSFANTKRTPTSAVGSGITNIRIMRPQSKTAGAAPCAPGTVVYPAVKTALQHYTVYRYFSNSFVDERTWSERTRPAMPNAFASPPLRNGSTSSKPCWEMLIMLANEMGKDLYLSLSPRADHDYYTKLANLLKYGSDGTNPYTSYSEWPAEGPAYPPLNPNLHFFIEFSNEVWNYGFAQWGFVNADANANITSGTADGQVINYDGNGSGQWQRWQALQTVRMSDSLRAVFGDAAMGNRIRVLMFDQYGGYGNRLCQFIDNYFNKVDPASTFAGPPHPVSYYIWGGGGAIYYGSDHDQGIDPDVQPANPSFETPALVAGDRPVAPAGATWNFTGNAGIYHNVARTQAVTGQVLGSTVTPTSGKWVGFKFTVGANPIYVYDVGRIVAPGNTASHPMQICKADGSGILSTTSSSVDTLGVTAGQYGWKRVTESGWTRNLLIPLQLSANTTYYVMSYESADAYYDTSTVTPAAGITINGTATASGSQSGLSGSITAGSTPNTAIGTVNFTFLDTAVGNLGFPCDAPDGVQAAFIGDTGSISQDILFPKTGHFALLFNAAVGGTAGTNAVDFYFDGAKCTPLTGDNPLWQVNSSPWAPGGFERRSDDLAILWGCTVFTVSTTGTHTIRVQGTGSAGKYFFLDNVRIVNEDELFGADCSHFPAMGQANGQNPMGGLNAYVNTLHGENNWAASWGLRTMAYEGGWSVGGDFDQKPFHAYCKYVSPLSVEANAKAVNVYTQGGGSLFCYYYNQWPDGDDDNATSYSLVKSVIAFNDHLPWEANWGALAPTNLGAANSTLWSSSGADSAGNLTALGAWISWNLIAPETQTYQLTSTVTGTGGAYVLLVDDANQVAAGTTDADLTGSIFLTKGQHTVKVRSTTASAIAVENIAVGLAGGPDTPALIGADFTSGSCVLTWTASAKAADYTIYYGTTSGNYAYSFDAGNATSGTLTGLDNSRVYYAAVQARDSANRLSLVSNELRFAHRSTDPEVIVDFEDQVVDGTSLQALDTKGYHFTGFGNLHAVRVDAPNASQTYPRTWKSKVLATTTWGTSHRVERVDQLPFDLYSFDLCTIYGGMSAIITGYDPTGNSMRIIVNTPTIASGQCVVIPITLDWVRIARLEVRWCNKPDGASTQDRAGSIDNLLINRSQLPAATPVFGPPGGTYATTQTVTIASATAGADIRYTTDSTDPTTTSLQYTAQLAVGTTTMLKARAYKAGLPASAVAATTYTIHVATHAPWWLRDPFAGAAATVGVPYTGTIAPNATDANGSDVLTFAKMNGPLWLNVAADGTLSGTPQATDIGRATFTVGVTDSLGASAYATLTIHVSLPQPPLPPIPAWIQIN